MVNHSSSGISYVEETGWAWRESYSHGVAPFICSCMDEVPIINGEDLLQGKNFIKKSDGNIKIMLNRRNREYNLLDNKKVIDEMTIDSIFVPVSTGFSPLSPRLCEKYRAAGILLIA
jgi:hypothetical protein